MTPKAKRPRNPMNPRGETCESTTGGFYDRLSPCSRTALLRSPSNGAWLCGVHSTRQDREVPLLERMLALAARAERAAGAGA